MHASESSTSDDQKASEEWRKDPPDPHIIAAFSMAFLKREAPAAAGWGPLFHALFFLLSLRKVDCGLLGIALGFIELKRALRLDRLSLSVVLPLALAVMLAVRLARCSLWLDRARAFLRGARFSWWCL